MDVFELGQGGSGCGGPYVCQMNEWIGRWLKSTLEKRRCYFSRPVKKTGFPRVFKNMADNSQALILVPGLGNSSGALKPQAKLLSTC